MSKTNFLQRWWKAIKAWFVSDDPTEPPGPDPTHPYDLILATSHTPWGVYPVPVAIFGYGSTDNYRPMIPRRVPVQLERFSSSSLCIGSMCPVIRYPGGQATNFHHPYGLNLGIEPSELAGVKMDFQKDILLAERMKAGEIPELYAIDECILQAKNVLPEGTRKVIYGVNVLTGSVAETVGALAKLEREGIEVIALEMSNELYMFDYRDVITAEQYVAKVKGMLQELRRMGVTIPAYIPVASREERGVHFQNWNRLMGQLEEVADGVVVHDYWPGGLEVLGGKDVAADQPIQFEELADRIYSMRYEDVRSHLDGACAHLGEQAGVIVTEWGIKKQGLSWRGTLIDAHYVVRYLGFLARYAAETGRLVAATLQTWVTEHRYGAGVVKWSPDAEAFVADAAGWIMDMITAHMPTSRVEYCGHYDDPNNTGLRVFVFSDSPPLKYIALVSNLSDDSMRIAVAGRRRRLHGIHAAQPWAQMGIKAKPMAIDGVPMIGEHMNVVPESPVLETIEIEPWMVGVLTWTA